MRSLGKNRKDRFGNKHGLWETYYYNGNLHMKGLYLNGLQEGIWDGKKDGVWEIYNPDGIISHKRLYENGVYIKKL